MILRIENPATLFLIAVILLGGCSGCSQKPTPQAPIEQSPEVSKTPTPVIETSKPVKKVETPVGTPKPDNALDAAKKAKLKALTATKGLSADERRRRRIEILIEGLDDMAAARICVSNRSWKAARPYLDKALAENPNDFETMLFWAENAVSTLENELDYTLNRKKVEVLRRLYEMNPNHHRVLYGLGRSIHNAYPKEALGYVQKAFELEPKHYANFLLLAKCYLKTGQYEKALAEYQRVFKSAGTNVSPDVLAGLYRLHRILELKDDAYREQIEKNEKRARAEQRKRLGLE